MALIRAHKDEEITLNRMRFEGVSSSDRLRHRTLRGASKWWAGAKAHINTGCYDSKEGEGNVSITHSKIDFGAIHVYIYIYIYIPESGQVDRS